MPQQRATLGEFLLAHAIRQEAEMPYPLEAVRGDMQHQAPQEFHGLERQGTQAMAALVIFVPEGDLAVLQGHEPVVGDSDAVGIAGQVLEHMLGVLEGLFGVDDPLLGAQGGEEPLPGHGLGEFPTATRQRQVTLRVGLCQAREVEVPEAPREDPDGQEEVRPTRDPLGPVGRQAPGGQDTMEMGMMVELLAPGVEHGEAPDLRAEMRGIPRDVLEGGGHRAKQQAIELARVLECQGPQGVRQGKDDMCVGGLEHLTFPGGEPRGLRGAMAFGAATVAAGVVRLDLMVTMVTLRDMSPEGRGPAHDNGPQGPVLRAREGGAIAGQKRGAMLAHHIGNFQRRPTHGILSRSAGNVSASKGLSVAWSAGWATWR